MTRSLTYIALFAAASTASAFTTGPAFVPLSTRPIHATAVQATPAAQMEEVEIETPKPIQNKKKNKGGNHKQGIFSPVVILAKNALGEERLNKIRANVISKHSDVIAAFVDTSDTEFGRAVLRAVFEAADMSRNGLIEEEELAIVLKSLGFDWLKEKQTKGIFERADADGNGGISLEEWYAAAPKTLRTNLIKLAKKNGGELGFLS